MHFRFCIFSPPSKRRNFVLRVGLGRLCVLFSFTPRCACYLPLRLDCVHISSVSDTKSTQEQDNYCISRCPDRGRLHRALFVFWLCLLYLRCKEAKPTVVMFPFVSCCFSSRHSIDYGTSARAATSKIVEQ